MMKKVFDRKLLLILIGCAVVVACGDDGIVEVPTQNDRIEEDLVKIEEYIQEKGYQNVDTTKSRVRYVILDEGDGELIEYNDIVTLHFAGRYLDDLLFYTSIDTVDLNNDSYDSTKNYNPVVFTHSASGWAMGQATTVSGFVDGTTRSLDKLRVNGHARIFIPTLLSTGNLNGRSIPTNEPVVYDIYPVKVRK